MVREWDLRNAERERAKKRMNTYSGPGADQIDDIARRLSVNRVPVAHPYTVLFETEARLIHRVFQILTTRITAPFAKLAAVCTFIEPIRKLNNRYWSKRIQRISASLGLATSLNAIFSLLDLHFQLVGEGKHSKSPMSLSIIDDDEKWSDAFELVRDLSRDQVFLALRSQKRR